MTEGCTSNHNKYIVAMHVRVNYPPPPLSFPSASAQNK